MKRIISIFLALLLLSSSIGMTLSTHYCGGHEMESSFNIGKDHLDCGMMDMTKTCSEHSRNEQQVSGTACCANEFTTYNIEDAFNSTTSFSYLDHNFFVALVYTTLSITINERTTYGSLISYASPPLFQDIPVLHQSFLL